MSVTKYKFVSPGVYLEEIDNSQLPRIPEEIGPVVIGRAQRGPGMRPVKVSSFSEFIEIFGNPIPGGLGGDVWRDGNNTAPAYGTYAAKAWLKNKSPLTYVRLLGTEHVDKTAAGVAGWQAGAVSAAGSGAYGLFMADSGSSKTGSLAAVWYFPNGGGIQLTGSLVDTGEATTGSAALVTSLAQYEFEAMIRNAGDSATVHRTKFNFNESSDKYIRKVFNTNPTLTNSTITNTDNQQIYWLGETFDQNVKNKCTAQTQVGVVLGLATGSNNWSQRNITTTAAETGWFFSQDLTTNYASFNPATRTNVKRLFKVVSLDTGQWESKNLKVSVADVKASTNLDSPYGSFTVLVRRSNDHDGNLKVVEQFSNCNLNPFSQNYVGRKIGTKYLEWNSDERRLVERGDYDNRSRYIRVSVDSDVDRGVTDARYLPFGVEGQPKFSSFTISSGSATVTANAFALGSSSIFLSEVKAANEFVTGAANSGYAVKFDFPAPVMRVSSSVGNISRETLAYFGVDTNVSGNVKRFDNSYTDVVFPLPESVDSSHASVELSSYFSLDDLVVDGNNSAVWTSGSRNAGNSVTALSGSYTAILDTGYNKFTTTLFGGFDGLDITEQEPFRNTLLTDKTEKNSYAYNTVKRAVDTLSDAEEYEFNIMALPGITEDSLTGHALDVCEARGDALFIMDLEGDYVPATEATSVTYGTSSTAISTLRDRGINSSYGCAYYPWVQVRDTENSAILWVPPSVVVLGAMASSERKTELWFAPAGFSRAGLTAGAAGLPVVGVRERLRKEDRDNLYEANINPIAKFPAEGIVIWGQKTLQVTPSALDRVNVRRLMIYVKKQISRMASTTLFDQNVPATWNRFKSKAQPFLDSIKSRFGLYDAEVILDETTTTEEMIDRNIIYAIVKLRPTKTAEFFAIDFNITNNGASFAD